MRACTRETKSRSPSRLDNCLHIGKLLATSSTSLSSRGIGWSILSSVDPTQKADFDRNYEYFTSKSASLMERVLADPNRIAQMVADWRETRSEFEVVKRLFERNGLPLTAPAS